MTNKSVFLIGIILSLLTIAILANRIEDGDKNAVFMYFIVFIIPALIIAVINTFYLSLLKNLQNKFLKIFLSLLPIIILALLSFKNNLIIPFIDGDLSFVAQATSISLGLTNIIWIIRLLSLESSTTSQ